MRQELDVRYNINIIFVCWRFCHVTLSSGCNCPINWCVFSLFLCWLFVVSCCVRFLFNVVIMRSSGWYYKDRLGRTRGPLELITLKTAWGAGIIDKNTFIWGEDMDEWAPIHMVYGLERAIATWEGLTLLISILFLSIISFHTLLCRSEHSLLWWKLESEHLVCLMTILGHAKEVAPCFMMNMVR